MFITFEGGEGSGKSTQIVRLAERLRSQGQEVACFREPGSAEGAEAIRHLVLNGNPNRWDPVEELYLFSAARHELVRTRIRPALDAQTIVLCDRFADSSAVYQGRAGGIPDEMLKVIEALATGGLTPDLTFLLDIPVEEGLARAGDRIAGLKGEQTDARFEGKDLSFHKTVRAAFLARADQFSERFRIINAEPSAETVAEQVWAHVEQAL